jgi:hypothetical protein
MFNHALPAIKQALAKRLRNYFLWCGSPGCLLPLGLLRLLLVITTAPIPTKK